MLFLEILLSIHGLLFVSSWMIGRAWLANQPSLKLKLARLLLVSCVIAPFIVHCIHTSQKPVWRHYASIDVLQDYAYKPILKAKSPQEVLEVETTFSWTHTSYVQLFYLLFCLLIAFRCYQMVRSLDNLRTLLAKAIPYKRSGKLIIKISDRCHIPFSVALYNKAYIVLPISIFSSSKNVMIAIAHEGQHHRNGDCLWAYFTQALRIIFFGNPGVSRWNTILNELQEFSCDEVLVGLPKISAYDYGHCLFDVLQTASQSSLSSQREIACTVGMALGTQNKDCTFIIRRISMLSNYPFNPSKSWLLGITLAGAFVVAPLCMAYTTVGSLANSRVKPADISHLNSKLQKMAESEIQAALKKYHATSAVVAIADPKTGNLLALAEAGTGNWKSRVFAPGSTIKPFIVAAAIDAGKSSERKSYECSSPYRIEGRTFSDWSPSNKLMTLTEAFAKSSNVCLIKVAQDTGAPLIRKKLSEFGFDMNSWWDDKQSKLQLAQLSIGEIPFATIESLAKSYAILANNGSIFNKKDSAIISSATAKSVDHMLINAVTQGTGKQAAVSNWLVAGKTGTVGESSDHYAQGKHFSLFAGYIPQYAMVVIVEDGYVHYKGKILASGGDIAAPVFRKVAMNSLNHI